MLAHRTPRLPALRAPRRLSPPRVHAVRAPEGARMAVTRRS